MHKGIRWGIALGTALMIVIGVEFGYSSSAEKAFAVAIAHNPQITVPPSVSLMTFPNMAELPHGRVGGLLVTLNDETAIASAIPRANVQVEYSNLRFDRNKLFHHQLQDFGFGEGTGRIYVSSGTLALSSTIKDLQFQAANDASPAGIGEDHAILSGTVRIRCSTPYSDYAHIAARVRSHVFFWKEAQRIEIDSEDLLNFHDVTPGRSHNNHCPLTDKTRTAAMSALELSLWVPHLPLGIQPQLAFAQSGNLVIVGPTPQSPITGRTRARFSNGTSSQVRWKNLHNYFKFAPQ